MSRLMMINVIRNLILLIVILFLVMIDSVLASPIDSIQIMKISAEDERAVIKTPDGKIQLIMPGGVVGENGKVLEITAGRVVVEERTGNDSETVIFRLDEDGKQRVERLMKVAKSPPSLYAVKKSNDQKTETKAPVKEMKKKAKKNNVAIHDKKSAVIK